MVCLFLFNTILRIALWQSLVNVALWLLGYISGANIGSQAGSMMGF